MKKQEKLERREPKLRLETETIRRLDDRALRTALGGFDLTEIDTRCWNTTQC